MGEQELINMAKEAYLLSKQLGALEEVVKNHRNVAGYRAQAENYNQILERAKQLLKHDEIIFNSIKHLKPYDSNKSSGYTKEFVEIGADAAVLKEALYTFFEFYFPKKEKEKIGFQ
jgi:ASC-1-like (ASCH) protein